jgi:hypothetical protein
MELNLPDPKQPYLYILMRSDLDSLNAGKMVAQGAHAANQFTHTMDTLMEDILIDLDNPDTESTTDKHQRQLHDMFMSWKTSTPQGFGVTICLDVTGDNLPLIVDAAKRAHFAAGVTHDPSYPIQDGRVVHSLPLDTCGYVFGDKSDLRILLGQFDLLK